MHNMHAYFLFYAVVVGRFCGFTGMARAADLERNKADHNRK